MVEGRLVVYMGLDPLGERGAQRLIDERFGEAVVHPGLKAAITLGRHHRGGHREHQSVPTVPLTLADGAVP